MEIHGIKPRTLENPQERDRFNKLQPVIDNPQYGLVIGSWAVFAIPEAYLKFEFIEADGALWVAIPEANRKVIVCLNLVKSGRTNQPLAQEEGVIDIGGTFNSSTENMNCVRGEEVRGPDQLPKNYVTYDDERNYEGLTKTLQKLVMKQYIDNKKVNDEHVIDMPEGPDLNDKKEQANDGGLFRLCELVLANTVSLMGSNPPPWATTLTSQKLSEFSGAANAVGFVGNTDALSLRDTKPWVARIFGNVGAIAGAWGVIMTMTSCLPKEFQWLGFFAAMFCALVVLWAN